jgi:lysozyme family protein
MFDGAVNLGVSRSAKMLQRVVGTTQDGSIGPLTLTAAKTVNLLMGIEALVTVRSDFYKSLPTFPTFGKGWLDRLAASRAMAMALSGGQITI